MLTLWGYVIMGMGASGGIGMSILQRKIGQFFFPGPRHEAYFSPNGGITAALVKRIAKARREILIQGFSFNSRTIADALCAAKKRGVHVEIVLDQIAEKDPSSDLAFLIDSGFEVQVDANHGCAHNKIMLLDNRVLATGSFNFTRQAEEENAENLLLVQGVPDLIHAYREQFLIHKAHARPAQRPGLLRSAAPISQGVSTQPSLPSAPIAKAPAPTPALSMPAAAPARPQPLAGSSLPAMPSPAPAMPVAQAAAPRPSMPTTSMPTTSMPTPAMPTAAINPALQGSNSLGSNNLMGTPSVAASLANMGLGSAPQATPPVAGMHAPHGQPSGPHLGNPLGGVTNLGGTQMTPEMLRAMVQNAANARNPQ